MGETFFRPLRDRGYLLSRTVGWLLAGWLLWLLASVGWAMNTVANAWLTVALLFLIGLAVAIRQWNEIRDFLRMNWKLLLLSEALFALSYLFFVYVRMGNPDLWHPWLGGEKFICIFKLVSCTQPNLRAICYQILLDSTMHLQLEMPVIITAFFFRAFWFIMESWFPRTAFALCAPNVRAAAVLAQ